MQADNIRSASKNPKNLSNPGQLEARYNELWHLSEPAQRVRDEGLLPWELERMQIDKN